MTEILIHKTGQKIYIPEAWSEMTDSQIRFVFRTMDLCSSQNKSPLEFNIRILYHLMNIEVSKKTVILSKLFPEKTRRMAENTYKLCQDCLDFLFVKKEDQEKLELSYSLFRNSLPELRSRRLIGRRLVGPADLLQDLTFGEFRRAVAAQQMFFKDKDVTHLDEMIAHLYRPRSKQANKAGRYVKPFKAEGFTADVAAVSTIPTWQKNLVLLWFSNCMKYLQSGDITINGEEISLSQLFSGGSSGGPSFGWNDLAVQIARDNIIGNITDVDEEPLFSIISIMWTNYKENKQYDAIRQAKKAK